MGNNKSSHGPGGVARSRTPPPSGVPRSASTASSFHQQQPQIRHPGRPADGAARAPRPTSDPLGQGHGIPHPNGPQVFQTPDPNFSLRVRDKGSNRISGRYHGNQLSVSNPNVSVAADPLSSPTGHDNLYGGSGAGVVDLSYLMGFDAKAARPEEVSMYRRTVAQVTGIWPEYHAVREIDYERLPPGIRTTLQQILKRLAEQHNSIREQRESRRDLAEQVHRLEAELQRVRSAASTGAAQTSLGSSDDSQGLLATAREQQTAILDISSDTGLGVDDKTLDSKMKRRERDGILKATPLLQAEGTHNQLRRAIVTRNQSLRPVAGGGDTSADFPTTTLASDPADQSSTSGVNVQRLEYSLERLRRENEILKNRLSDPTVPSDQGAVVKSKSVSASEWRENFHQLEALALGKVQKALANQLSHTNRKRQEQFVCAVMQKSYDISLRTANHFKDAVRSLIVNPVNLDVLSLSGRQGRDVRGGGGLSNHIHFLEGFKPGQGINNNISKLAKRNVTGQDLPEILANQLYDYMESTSDVIDITDLVQAVADELRHEFGDCTTPALLNQASFNGFLRDCCRLSWRMCVPQKQLFVCSHDFWRFEERYHVTASSKGTTNARIEHYIWPILFSRTNEGEVLYKGRVSLKL